MSQRDLLLARLEAALRSGGAKGRKTVRTAAFDVYVAENSSGYILNFAVPRVDTGNWDEAIAEMQRAFAANGRLPRLEYFQELHPSLAAALEARGFVRDMVAPVMALCHEALASQMPDIPGTLMAPEPSDPGLLEAFVLAQGAAFGGFAGSRPDEFMTQMTRGLEEGTLLIRALLQDGKPVSGATIVLGDDAGELAGVWTAAGNRRRGLAYTVCRDLLAAYFAAGYELCWLSAAEDARGLYERLGFRSVGTQLNYGKQAMRPGG